MALTNTVDPAATEETLSFLQETVKNFSWEKAAVIVGLTVACLAIIKIVMGLADRTMERAKMDPGVRTFLRSGLKVFLYLVAVCVILGYLGVPMTSLVALLSVFGLAVSLAIQGTLSNLAGGIMLLTSRPFTVGDYVDAAGVSGTVQEVGLVYTKLSTVDNKLVCVPNGEISSKTIVNYTAADKRQVELFFETSYDAPPETVKACMARVVGTHPLIYPTPEPLIRVRSYKDNSIEYILRCWVDTGNYWPVYYDLVEGVKAEFDKNGVEMTYPHVNVHMVP